MNVAKSMATCLSMLSLALFAKPVFAEGLSFATVDLVPYVLHDDPGGRLGLMVDIDTAIAERMGIPVADEVLPMARAIKNLERGLTDCVVIALTPWSESKFQPVAKILNRFDAAIITREGVPITRIEDIHGLRLAITRGSFADSPISSDPNITQVPTNGYEQSVRLFKAGRVDAVAGSELSIFYYFAAEQISRKDIGGILPIIHASLWLHCAKGQVPDDVILRLQETTNELRAEGVFTRLLKRYIPDDFS
ncbi:transporter substrate-binding domain-containing protein [Parasedimentitalea maritima]|uniref:Transporter substrate-binding domain-containing protein n=1 Tax=Parasedimentitalea maritima TaxID=2578117 RepID=A0ABY2V2I0_9RHOB|nr:transporter substrate-binding domain-containing protein [Zongyanglinia marina]TLP67145.1 transporter substrate-binding domain-containing protein [Zongyanglinia marina]